MKQFNNVTIKLKIADIVIQMHSNFALEQLTEEEKREQVAERFKNFFYSGRQKPHIKIKVKIVDKLPRIYNTKHIFTTYHFQDGSENWRLCKKDDTYIYKSPLEEKKQLMLVNRTFDKVTAYLLPKDKRQRREDRSQKTEVRRQKSEVRGQRTESRGQGEKEFVWNISDIIYDFLQVLLINYLAVIKKDGIFTHSMGVKDIKKCGLLFAGKSESGKTTLAKIYHKHSKAVVLNDDRIIIRKINPVRKSSSNGVNNDFYIYGSPWHGDFSDYLMSRIEKAKLKSILFLKKSKENSIKPVSLSKAFKLLYPAMFPTFWDREGTKVITMFLTDLLSKVSCFRLKFKKDKSVIGFVRKIDANSR